MKLLKRVFAFLFRPELSSGQTEGIVYKKELLKFNFSTKVCAICEPTGFPTKPDFWIDFK
jgi:hypothetical protein